MSSHILLETTLTNNVHNNVIARLRCRRDIKCQCALHTDRVFSKAAIALGATTEYAAFVARCTHGYNKRTMLYHDARHICLKQKNKNWNQLIKWWHKKIQVFQLRCEIFVLPQQLFIDTRHCFCLALYTRCLVRRCIGFATGSCVGVDEHMWIMVQWIFPSFFDSRLCYEPRMIDTVSCYHFPALMLQYACVQIGSVWAWFHWAATGRMTEPKIGGFNFFQIRHCWISFTVHAWSADEHMWDPKVFYHASHDGHFRFSQNVVHYIERNYQNSNELRSRYTEGDTGLHITSHHIRSHDIHIP